MIYAFDSYFQLMEDGEIGEIMEIVVKLVAQATWLGHEIVTVLHQLMEDYVVPGPIAIKPHATSIDVQVANISMYTLPVLKY